MKRIIKQPQPQALLQWKRDNRDIPENLIYKNLPKEPVRQALLLEQFHLCAYTMKRLKTLAQCLRIASDAPTKHSCHIEHFLPQVHYSTDAIEYQNMLTCFPPANSKKHCDYGAKKKDCIDPQHSGLISPLSANAEAHFSYQKNGIVKPASPQGDATIKLLNLNHPILSNDRKAVIQGALYAKGKLRSAAELERIAQRAVVPNKEQCLDPYCLAIAQVALDLARKEKDRAQRMKKEK